MTEQEAVRRLVEDGDYIATELYGGVRCPMSLAREVVRQGKKHLRAVGQGVLELDLWLAAGLVDAMDITYHGLEVRGVSSVLRRTAEAGRVKLVEWSNGAIAWRMKAAAMGVPFIPVKSMLGTDTLAFSAAKVVECPFTGDRVCLLPALNVDVALIHVHRADCYGNAQIDGISGFSFELARACRKLIVSAEEIVDTEELRRTPDRTTIPYYLVDAVVHAPFGSHPGEMVFDYIHDEEHMSRVVEASRTEDGMRAYLEEWVYGTRDHEAYLDRVGRERLAAFARQAVGR
ncbi:MAG: CoA transferase subunit A [Gemmatimonadetes bacterium]|nr:CoA transferase subunit A [Gemmatimonadota bacterium]